MRSLGLVLAVAVSLAACGGDDDDVPEGTVAIFDLDGDLGTSKTFFDFPFPSDLRLTADGRPDLTGFPNPRDIPLLDALITVAGDRDGWPVMPVAFFQFTAPLAPRVETDVIPATADAPVLLIDLADRTLVPTVARTLTFDDYLRNPTLGVAPFPGFVLRGDRSYAFVVMRSVGDEGGADLDVVPAFAALAAGDTPDAARGAAAQAAYAPLWPALADLGIDREQVAVATIVTTGDVVRDLAELSSAVRDEYDPAIRDLALDPDDGATHDRFCELLAFVDLPQFQRGQPPFNDEGTFDIGADGLPVWQRDEAATVVLVIPKTEMPAAGYPLMLYFHGSGGIAATVVDRGPRTSADGEPAKGEGPGYVVAEHGIASAAAALPLSPDRYPGASYTEYLNFNNLAAFRDTFRQGAIEQRLFLDALLDLRIDPAVLTGCDGPTLPAGATAFSFDPDGIVASGQSMGGLYTNVVTPIDARIRAAVPTGAGGYWSYFILETGVIEGTLELLAVLLGTPFEELTYLHPAMRIIQIAWEPAEPMVYMPRLARRPLPGHPVRPIYEPAPMGDFFFRTEIYDAAALSYGHTQAGDEVWDTMQPGLTLAGLGGIIDYPVADNVTSDDGAPYTGVVVQYPGDGIDDPHYIYAQRDDVKYQYGCFFKSLLETGTAVVPAPAALGTPCP